MLSRSIIATVLAFLSFSSETFAGSFRIPIPKNIPLDVAIEIVTQIAKAIELEAAFKPDGVAAKVAPPEKPSLSFFVPIDVYLSETEQQTLLGLPVWGTRIQVSVSVRCLCTVAYNLEDVKVEGNEYVFPDPTVYASFRDPPGKRGQWTSNAGYFRSQSSSSIDALKLKLLDESLVEAKNQYLNSRRTDHEIEVRDQLEKRIAKLAESRTKKEQSLGVNRNKQESKGESVSRAAMLATSLSVAAFLVGLVLFLAFKSRTGAGAPSQPSS